MNKLLGYGIAILALWAVVHFGWADAILAGLISDLSSEADRMTGPIAGLATSVAVPIAVVALIFVISEAHRAKAIAVMVAAGLVILGAHLLPSAGHWLNGQGQVMAQNLQAAPSITSAQAQGARR